MLPGNQKMDLGSRRKECRQRRERIVKEMRRELLFEQR
jgi:hypothetical protein